MPSVTAQVEYLANIPLYQTEKPYLYLPGKDEDLDPEQTRLDNLEFEQHSDIHIEDMRHRPDLKIEECGFEYCQHQSRYHEFSSPRDIDGYKVETEQLLKKRFSAVKVSTYEVRLRKNQDFHRKEFDIYDKMLVEGPAKGAHNGLEFPPSTNRPKPDPSLTDVTYTSGPNIIRRYLSIEDQDKYLRKGYRIQIFNTWRPLNRILEDRPLALCDSRTVNPNDLMAADRILPDRVGEVYYLLHNSHQKWYWLEKQKTSEPFIFLMYDTASHKNSARFCPHVSFDNPNRPENVEPRSSIETRSIVITQHEL